MQVDQRPRPAAPEIVLWRREQLVVSGFPAALAERVAHDAAYDLHELIELVERGCPPRLALRILAPLDEDGGFPE